MRTLAYTLVTTCSIILFSCKQAENANSETPSVNNAREKVLTAEDSAYRGAMAFHDEVMPKMGKLMSYQKKAQLRLDTISMVMKRDALPGMKEFKLRVDTLLFQLKQAEKEMNDWMEGFNPDPKLTGTEERTAYFLDQKAKAQKMRDHFMAALDKAKELLGE